VLEKSPYIGDESVDSAMTVIAGDVVMELLPKSLDRIVAPNT
jgi:hypothetical protein